MRPIASQPTGDVGRIVGKMAGEMYLGEEITAAVVMPACKILCVQQWDTSFLVVSALTCCPLECYHATTVRLPGAGVQKWVVYVQDVEVDLGNQCLLHRQWLRVCTAVRVFPRSLKGSLREGYLSVLDPAFPGHR